MKIGDKVVFFPNHAEGTGLILFGDPDSAPQECEGEVVGLHTASDDVDVLVTDHKQNEKLVTSVNVGPADRGNSYCHPAGDADGEKQDGADGSGQPSASDVTSPDSIVAPEAEATEPVVEEAAASGNETSSDGTSETSTGGPTNGILGG